MEDAKLFTYILSLNVQPHLRHQTLAIVESEILHYCRTYFEGNIVKENNSILLFHFIIRLVSEPL